MPRKTSSTQPIPSKPGLPGLCRSVAGTPQRIQRTDEIDLWLCRTLPDPAEDSPSGWPAPPSIQQFGQLLAFIFLTLKHFQKNQGILLAGAIAYYALLSIVPSLS